MVTDRKDSDDANLLDLFAAARTAAPVPSPALQARVLADADQVAAERDGAVRPRRADRRGSWLGGLWAALGGWQGGTGLAAATIAGLAIGFGAPGVVPGVTSVESDLVDGTELAVWLWPGVDAMLDEPLGSEEG